MVLEGPTLWKLLHSLDPSFAFVVNVVTVHHSEFPVREHAGGDKTFPTAGERLHMLRYISEVGQCAENRFGLGKRGGSRMPIRAIWRGGRFYTSAACDHCDAEIEEVGQDERMNPDETAV